MSCKLKFSIKQINKLFIYKNKFKQSNDEYNIFLFYFI